MSILGHFPVLANECALQQRRGAWESHNNRAPGPHWQPSAPSVVRSRCDRNWVGRGRLPCLLHVHPKEQLHVHPKKEQHRPTVRRVRSVQATPCEHRQERAEVRDPLGADESAPRASYQGPAQAQHIEAPQLTSAPNPRRSRRPGQRPGQQPRPSEPGVLRLAASNSLCAHSTAAGAGAVAQVTSQRAGRKSCAGGP
jgi:hypothetical protein